jgi:hypothetical protein
MKLVLDLNVGKAAELVELSCLSKILGREISVSELIEMRIAGEVNSFPNLWITSRVESSSGSTTLRSPRMARRNNESERDFCLRVVGVFDALKAAIYESPLGQESAETLVENYASIQKVFLDRAGALEHEEKDRIAQAATNDELDRQEALKRKKARETSETTKKVRFLGNPFATMSEEASCG